MKSSATETPSPHPPQETAAPTSPRLDRIRDRLVLSALMVAVAWASFPMFRHVIEGRRGTLPRTDYSLHSAWLAEMRAQRRVLLPHPLYHLSVLSVERVMEAMTGDRSRPRAPLALSPGAGDNGPREALIRVNHKYASAAIVALEFFQCAWVAVLWWYLGGTSGGRSWLNAIAVAAIILALLVVAPVALFFGTDHQFYLGYVGLNVWHNPTVFVARPLALLAFALGSRAATHAPECGRRAAACTGLTALVTVAGALAKPSFLICYVPALGAVVAWQWLRRHPVNWALYVVGVALPSALLMAWQYRITYDARGNFGGVAWASVAPMAIYSRWLAPKFLLSIVFPLACYVAWCGNAWKSVELDTAWLAFAIGSAFAYNLEETRQPASANFSWSAQLSLLVLFAASARFVLQRVRESAGEPERARRTVLRVASCALALSFHVAFGVVYVRHLIGTPNNVFGFYQ